MKVLIRRVSEQIVITVGNSATARCMHWRSGEGRQKDHPQIADDQA